MQQPKMALGEKIETIVLSRASGAFGEWLGESAEFSTVPALFGKCSVDGVTYDVYRSAEVTEDPYWSVVRTSDEKWAFGDGQYDLARITEGDFQ